MKTSARPTLPLGDYEDLRAALDEHAIVAVTDPSGRITSVNDKFCTISGYPREELLGQNHRIINSGHHGKGFFRGMWSTIASGRVWHGEIRNKAKDGTFYWVATTICPFLGKDGEPRHYVSIRTDITERKRAEEAYERLARELEKRVAERTAQLEDANRELEAFSYSVSHDLRAPLRAIDGFTQVIAEEFGALLPEDGRATLGKIRHSTQQMAELIDALLSLSQSGRGPLKKESIDMEELVHRLLEDPNLGKPDPKATVTVGKLAPGSGDPALLERVWSNLISNAFKYTRKHPSPRIEIGSRMEGSATAYFIRDNGAGFDMRYVGKLFGAFQRLHRVEDYEGAGVGLAIVKRIIERHGGRVWAEAKPDRGATFLFTLEEGKGDPGGNQAREATSKPAPARARRAPS